MHSPLEKKFNEYVGKIHTILHDDVSYLSEPTFINQLLDRMELVKRNFILMNADTDDVYLYQDRLASISAHTRSTVEWVDNFDSPALRNSSTISSLRENLFMMSDLFQTSHNLIKSFYPVS